MSVRPARSVYLRAWPGDCPAGIEDLRSVHRRWHVESPVSPRVHSKRFQTRLAADDETAEFGVENVKVPFDHLEPSFIPISCFFKINYMSGLAT